MAGRISVRGELQLDGSGWERSLRKAGQQTEQFASEGLGELKGMILQAFSVGAVVEFGRSIIETVRHIKDMSEQFGVSTNDVQILGRAATNVGLTFEDVGTALSRLGHARKEAATGNVALQQTFEKLGVTYRDLQDPAKSNLSLLEQIGQALKGVELNSAQREELRELMGRGGDKLAAIMEQLHTMTPPQIIDREQIDKIDKAAKDVHNMYEDLKAMGAIKLAPIAPLVSGGSGESKLAALGALADFSKGPTESFIGFLVKKLVAKTYSDPLMAEAAEQTKNFPNVSGIEAKTTENGGPLYPGHFRYDIEANNEKIAKSFREAGPTKSLGGDALVRVGNFLGDAPQMVQIAQKQLRLAERTANSVEEIARNTRPQNDEGLGF